jgi:hypothetical protein
MKKFMLLSNSFSFLISLIINFIYYFGGSPSTKIGSTTGAFYQLLKIIVLILDLWMLKKFCEVVKFFISRKKIKLEDKASFIGREYQGFTKSQKIIIFWIVLVIILNIINIFLACFLRVIKDFF